jgi:hypothetical protein
MANITKEKAPKVFKYNGRIYQLTHFDHAWNVWDYKSDDGVTIRVDPDDEGCTGWFENKVEVLE